MTTAQSTTHTLNVPGATLAYDVRPNATTTEPVLLLIGSPMGAAGFGTLSSHFADRTVVTYDPRGAERSEKTDPASPSTPEEHADDLHRLIEALDSGPVDLFASSGGAVNALALVERHPEQVRTLVAHEPPLLQLLARPRRRPRRRARHSRHVHALRLWRRHGQVHRAGPASRDRFRRTGSTNRRPIRRCSGCRPTDDGSRTDALLGQNMTSSTGYEPDFDALRRASTRIVIAAGAESEGELANRGAHAVAERLGMTPVIFPSNHGGFLGGEYGQAGRTRRVRREAAPGSQRGALFWCRLNDERHDWPRGRSEPLFAPASFRCQRPVTRPGRAWTGLRQPLCQTEGAATAFDEPVAALLQVSIYCTTSFQSSTDVACSCRSTRRLLRR